MISVTLSNTATKNVPLQFNTHIQTHPGSSFPSPMSCAGVELVAETQSNSKLCFVTDKLERKHIKIPHVGPSAEYGAYDPIEHLWSPLSKKLNSVKFKAIDGDDTHPPCCISGLSLQERREKEARVFDQAISDLCESYWKDASFDGHKVKPVKVKCASSRSDDFYTDHEHVHAFLKAPLREIFSSKYSILKDFNFMLNHIDRRHNELIFMKCSSPHCTTHPVAANHAQQFLHTRGRIVFNPQQSATHPGHYYTFLEMCELEQTQLQSDDSGIPSCVGSDLGRCPLCPAFSFMSKTEKQRHMSVFHRRHSSSQKPQNHACVCGLKFTSTYLLRKHKKAVGHTTRRKRTTSSAKKQCTPVIVAHAGSGQDEGNGKPKKAVGHATKRKQTTNPTKAVGHTTKRKQTTNPTSWCTPVIVAQDEESDVSDIDEESVEVCMVCGRSEAEDVEVETWVLCEKCIKWIHERCIPPTHAFNVLTDHFICQKCL